MYMYINIIIWIVKYLNLQISLWVANYTYVRVYHINVKPAEKKARVSPFYCPTRQPAFSPGRLRTFPVRGGLGVTAPQHRAPPAVSPRREDRESHPEAEGCQSGTSGHQHGGGRAARAPPRPQPLLSGCTAASVLVRAACATAVGRQKCVFDSFWIVLSVRKRIGNVLENE